MNKIDYQALRESAEKATCGVWSLEYGESRFDCDDALIHREVVGYLPICRIEGAHPESGFDEDFQMEQQANAEFIAAASPATVLALLDELEAAENRIAELESLTAKQLTQQAVMHDAATAIRACLDEFPEVVRDIVEECAAIAENACRAAMLQGAEPVTTAYKLPFEQWLSQQAGTIDVECGCVMTEVFFHWLRVAYEAGKPPVIPDGWQLVPKEPTVAMNKAGWAAINEHDEINPTYRAMLAAAPQQDVRLALEIGMSRYAGAMQKLVDSGD